MVTSAGDPHTYTSLYNEWQLPSNVGMLHLSWDRLWLEGVCNYYDVARFNFFLLVNFGSFFWNVLVISVILYFPRFFHSNRES